jgi:hypothetical protein
MPVRTQWDKIFRIAVEERPRCQCGYVFDPTPMEWLGGREYRIPGSGCSKALAVGDDFVAITWPRCGYGVANSSRGYFVTVRSPR